MRLTKALALAYARWTAEVAKARADYHRVPNRACRANDCDNLRDDGAIFCDEHVAMMLRANRGRA